MKKLITFLVSILLVIPITMPVMAEERKQETVFETDLSVCKEDYLSVYGKNIREYKNGDWSDCDCIQLCNCISLYHILENKTEDNFYSAFFNGEYLMNPIAKIYQDRSSSMEEIFCYEKSNIIKNLSPILNEKELDIEDIFKNEKTNLYGFLSLADKVYIDGKYEIISPKEAKVIITDLWNTEDDYLESFSYSGEIIFCVPYASTNKEGVLHCEEFVNNFLLNYDWLVGYTHIYVVYTDEVIVEYSNVHMNFSDGCMTIYIP